MKKEFKSLTSAVALSVVGSAFCLPLVYAQTVPAGKTEKEPKPDPSKEFGILNIPISHIMKRTPEQMVAREKYMKDVKEAQAALDNGELDTALIKYQMLNSGGEETLGYIDSLAGLAEVYWQRGDYNRAIPYFRELVYEKPGQTWSTSQSDQPDICMKFALTLYKRGLYQEALNVYQKGAKRGDQSDWGLPLALTLDSDSVRSVRMPIAANLVLARYFLNGYSQKSLVYAQEALRLSPNFALSHLYLAECLRSTGIANWPERKREYEQAVKLGRGEVKEKAEAALRRRY